MASSDEHQLLTIDDIARTLNVTRQGVINRRQQAKTRGPRYLPAEDLLVGNKPLWHVSTIRSWLESEGWRMFTVAAEIDEPWTDETADTLQQQLFKGTRAVIEPGGGGRTLVRFAVSARSEGLASSSAQRTLRRYSLTRDDLTIAGGEPIVYTPASD